MRLIENTPQLADESKPKAHDPVTQPKPALISLFCGAGGMDIGFEKAGFNVAFAADYDQAAVTTYNQNAKRIVAHRVNLLDQSAKKFVNQIVTTLGEGVTPRGIIGGPPCQGFSKANINRSNDDPRNELAVRYAEIVNAAAAVYPIEFFVFENVPGIKEEDNKEFFESLQRRLRGNFSIFQSELNAADYGVPQARKRFFMVGLRRKDEIKRTYTFPAKTAETHVTVRAALGLLPEPQYFSHSLTPEKIPFHPNHWTMQPRSKRFKETADSPNRGRSFIRLSWDKPSRTVAYGHREIHVHPEGHRRLSIYEAMLLQGFPTTYQLTGNLSEQVTQVSNAVPPPLAQAIASSLRTLLEL